MRRSTRRPLKERFLEKLPSESERKPDECWDWQGSCSSAGYGHIGSGGKRGKTLNAHRIAFELLGGKQLPDGMHVLHHCDNRRCCNPLHLYAGTNRQNCMDRIERSGYPSGEFNPNANVPDDAVREAVALIRSGSYAKDVVEHLRSKGYSTSESAVRSWANGVFRQSALDWTEAPG